MAVGGTIPTAARYELRDRNVDGTAAAAAKAAMTAYYNVGKRKSSGKDQAPNATTKPARKRPRPPPVLIECVSCQDELRLSGRIAICIECKPDKHYYCRPCLRQLLNLAMKDQSLYPPSCCGTPIPEKMIEAAVSDSMFKKFKKETISFGTPAKDRLWCPKPTCGKFIPLSEGVHLGEGWGKVQCSNKRCKTDVCIHCKQVAHMDDCSDDAGFKQIVDMGKESGWMRCPNCWSMGDRLSGCQWLNCFCGIYYCSLCGKAGYGTCGCNLAQQNLNMVQQNNLAQQNLNMVQRNLNMVQQNMN